MKMEPDVEETPIIKFVKALARRQARIDFEQEKSAKNPNLPQTKTGPDNKGQD